MEVNEALRRTQLGSRLRQSNWVRTVAVSLALVIPCFWQPIVSSSDLQSHIYNAWLAELIRSGSIHGLWIGNQSTNILVDTLFPGLLRLFGVSGSERVLAAASILIFFWGALRFIAKFGKRPSYWLVPWLAILSYGFAFQSGLLNYYLSCGIVFWALALLWGQISGWRILWGALLLALAYRAHPLPVLWFLGVLAYCKLAQRMPARSQPFLFLGCAVLLLLVRAYAAARYLTMWMPRQLIYWTGTDQALLYGWLYLPVFIGFLLFSAILLSEPENRWRAISSVPAQAYFLTGLAIVIFPFAIRRSVEGAWASHIGDRLSLLSGVLLLAILGRSTYRRWYLSAGLLAAALFFVALYRDIGRESRIEAKIHKLVETLPAGERVVSYIGLPYGEGRANLSARDGNRGHSVKRVLSVFTERINSSHLVSRACLGHCFDYANYEPATGQFRIHAVPGNPVVLATWPDVDHMLNGTYFVRASDLPLYVIFACGSSLDDIVMLPITQGESGAALACPGVPAAR